MALDPLSKIPDAGLELAWAEHRREPLDEADLDALDLCDEIGGERSIVAFEVLRGRVENSPMDLLDDGTVGQPPLRFAWLPTRGCRPT